MNEAFAVLAPRVSGAIRGASQAGVTQILKASRDKARATHSKISLLPWCDVTYYGAHSSRLRTSE